MSKQGMKQKKRPITSSKKRQTQPQKRGSYSPRMPQKKVVKVKRRKLRFGRVFFILLFLSFFYWVGSLIWSIPVQTIFISGNTILTDQQILEIAHLEEYPSYLGTSKSKIVQSLKENVYIKNGRVKKKGFRELLLERKRFYRMEQKSKNNSIFPFF